MDDIKLKPCPFCGGIDVHIEEDPHYHGSYIQCYECLASFYQAEAICIEDNVRAWNRRAFNG